MFFWFFLLFTVEIEKTDAVLNYATTKKHTHTPHPKKILYSFFISCPKIIGAKHLNKKAVSCTT